MSEGFGIATTLARIERGRPLVIVDADEVLLTNSSFGVLPVAAVEARGIRIGDVGREMARAWQSRGA